MFIAFENGELDLLLKADSKDYDRALAGNVAHPETTSCYTVTINSLMSATLGAYCEYFEDAKVREAVAHALDAEAIALVAYGSLAQAGVSSFLSPMFTGAYESQGIDQYDVEYAKQCMAESAYPDGFSIHCIALNTDSLALEVAKENLAAIGIDLNVDIYDFSAWAAALLTPGATDFTLLAGASSIGPYEAIFSYSANNALTGTCVLDPRFNELLDALPATFDEDEVNEMLKELQRLVYEQKWIIPLFEVSYAICYDNTVLSCDLTSCSTCSYVQFDCVPVSG